MSRSKETPAVGPSGPGGTLEPSTEDGLSAPPGCPPPAMPTAGAGTGANDPPRARRLVRHLPRAVLILVLIAIPIVFHSVLLPFVLAIFFAYLIYPVVRRLERIPIGRRYPPRWLAVITVYAMLFVVGWWTIPPLITNFGEQLNKLVHDVPTLFEKMQSNRKRFEAWIASAFEVDSLSEATRVDLFADVNALAVGNVQAFAPPEGLELPPPPPPSTEGELPLQREPAAPTIVQFMPFNLNFGSPPESRPVVPAAIPSADEEAPAEEASGTAEEVAAAPPVEPEGDGEQQVEPAPPRRFEETQATAFKEALRDSIDAELEKPGPAKGIPERVEREIVPELAQKELGLPPDDPQVALFARNCGARVAAAIARENYGKAITAYFESAVISARSWVQRNLNQAAGLAGGLIAGLVRGIFDFFMVLMLTAFFLVFFPRIRDYLRDLFAPQYRDDYSVVLKRIDTRLSGAIRGQVIICIVNAVLTFPGLWFIGVFTEATNLAAYAVLLSVIAGVLSMIPIFGVILSTVPMVILALAQGSVWGAFLVISWICVIHAIEAYVLNPNILGHSASMNPIIVVFALLAGKQLYGLVGALLAVPVASVLVSLFGYYRRLVVEQSATEQGVAAPADPWGD